MNSPSIMLPGVGFLFYVLENAGHGLDSMIAGRGGRYT